MFSFFKNLLRKAVETPAANQSTHVQERDRVAPPSISQPPPGPRGGFAQNGKGIELPLRKILSGLPLELQPRVRLHEVGAMAIAVPLEKILAQLSRGVVKLTFGELRLAAPGVFSPEGDRDRILVPLPLDEILSRLNPALIARRRVQRQVEVPEEIGSPFDVSAQGLAIGGSPAKVAPEPVATPTPPRSMAPATPPLDLAGRIALGAVPPPPAPTVAPAEPLGRNSIFSAPTPPPPAALPPAAPALRPAVEPVREFNGHPPSPVPSAVPAPGRPANEPEPLTVNLTALAESWPEAVRKEVVTLNLVEAKVALPAKVVEQGLRQGRLAFSWKLLRCWIQPPVAPTASALDGLVLELPLKVVAPLFLGRQRDGAKTQHKVTIDDDIPNLFFGFPQPEGSNAQVTGPQSTNGARPQDTNYYVWDDSADLVRVDESTVKHAASPGTRFVAKYATPNEVVSRAAAIEGVAGALIALPDGLMVANCLPGDVNGDTLAAFLPQIFGKVSQCTKELRMGELNNLNFTVGNVPWKIFRVNAIFFAAFGRAGQGLPTAQLAALAAELDHKPK
ncbi:MAG TPA: roadblock/LC7 domain-containing protein [Candidatus Sulfotelmatobacter sp.]|nr:roadblock/LC7 domain-containing protein [Candidatus Sulfotelmatobacter sp.]